MKMYIQISDSPTFNVNSGIVAVCDPCINTRSGLTPHGEKSNAEKWSRFNSMNLEVTNTNEVFVWECGSITTIHKVFRDSKYLEEAKVNGIKVILFREIDYNKLKSKMERSVNSTI